MKKFFTFLMIFSGVLSVILFSTLCMEGQVQFKKMKMLKLKTMPKILMERTQLESARGMRVYKIRTLKVSPELLKNVTRKFQLKLSARMMQRTRRAKGQVFYSGREGKFTRMIVNERRGHINLLPNIQKLSKMKVKLIPKNQAMEIASNYIRSLKLVPADSSRFKAKKVTTLSSVGLRNRKQNLRRDLMQTVLFQRTLDGKAVVGNGSQVSVNIGSNGKIEGFQRIVNKLVPTEYKGELRSNKEIYDRIEGILRKNIKGNVQVQVGRPRLVYYGNDRQFVQPAYFFSAKISSPKSRAISFYYGVVSALQNPPEKISIARNLENLSLPSAPKTRRMRKLRRKNPPLPPGDPIIGRYVVRNDSRHWVGDANDFRSGLLSGHAHCGGCAALSFTQYYWNSPSLFTSLNDYFVDRCHVVLMEGHGNHWLFTTRSNCCDVVSLNSPSQPGYGAHAGGIMTFLILKGCSIVPSPIEVGSHWPDPWWRIFKGLREVAGFRTTMYINDNISDNFGYWLGKNCRFLDSWFYSTNTCWSYRWNRFWGAHVTGYGSVVMIPGQEGAGIYHTSPAASATSTGLRMYWQH